ncbi:GNAT family N-acetyltransferase [Alkalicoccus saliphilus]|uniref:GNAT family N-acetyltransferase n=1 Tax=Alkalicoccus saliphilus TaxID=200989 RepID=A0A2T4U2F4_9BACI|nr:GNAT family N-acetyltransferase [Alkalicoccus saliphilus]PTL37574.1 GNAT family N-acetyltransferase [Alkalicoccus saliphilus]
MKWHIKKFEDFSPEELYRILQIRVEVFVVEQNCPYPEIDGKDKDCWHLYAEEHGEILAYARLLPPGLSYEEAAIGRVLVAEVYRGSGLGKELMEQSVAFLNDKMNYSSIRLQAQEYAEKFYSSFGFQRISETYLEDNIPHVDMKKVD